MAPPFQTGFPKDNQFVDGLGNITPLWYMFLYALWSKTGGGVSTITNTYTIIQETGGGPPVIIDNNGNSQGQIGTIQPKGAAELQTLSGSPFSFAAPANGMLTAYGGQIEYSRDGTNFYTISNIGGQFVMVKGDTIKVVWYGDAPQVVWWPGGI